MKIISCNKYKRDPNQQYHLDLRMYSYLLICRDRIVSYFMSNMMYN